MPGAGDRYEMPDGSVYTLVRTAADTGGEYVEMEFVLPDGCVPPPPHVHTGGTEEYEVAEGKFEITVDGEWRTLDRGEQAVVPVGALHTFRNRSGAPVRVRNFHRPSMRFDEYIERVHDVLAEMGTKGKRDPRLLMALSSVSLAYPETLVFPRSRDRIPMRIMAALGRVLRLPGGRS